MQKGLKRELGQACKNRLTDESSINRLFKKYKDETHGQKPDIGCAQMLMNLAYSDIRIATEIIETIPIESRTEALYTIYIKGLCENGLIDDALEQLQFMTRKGIHPHVRTFIGFFQSQINHTQFDTLIQYIFKYDLIPNMELFEHMFNNIPSSEHRDIHSIYKLFNILSNHHHHVSDNLIRNLSKSENISTQSCNIDKRNRICNKCNIKAYRCDIDDDQKLLMMECLKYDGIVKLDQFINNHKFDIVIDGSNVAMYNNSPFNFNKVYKLLKHLPPTGDVLLVFHIGRKKIVEKYLKHNNVVLPNNVHTWYSKVGQDDDLSWLYATIKINGVCVTSDKLRDHLFYRFSKVIQQHTFERWIETHVVKFDFQFDNNQKWKVHLSWPHRIGFRTIVNEQERTVHMPVMLSESTVWWCCKV